jgi:4'-phosphopantetheinyl transferase EntD
MTARNTPVTPLNVPLRALFACDVAVACAAPREMDDELYPDERAHIASSVAKRRAEFGTARVVARRALAELGFPPMSLVPYPDRAPRWPEGVVGSISHCTGLCAVVVARSSFVQGLGLDVECAGQLDAALETTICTTAERQWLASYPPEERGHWAKMLFSAKEAFYKCQFPTTRTFLDYLEVDVRINVEDGTFAVTCARSGAQWRAVEMAKGRHLRTGELIVTAATLMTPD